MGNSYRPGRLGEEIKKIISNMLLRELKDPRLNGMVSVTAVDMSPDSSYANVFLTVFSTDQKDMTEEEEKLMKENVLSGMESAKGLIKREINSKIKLRKIPELVFRMDTSFEYGRHIDDVLDEVMKKDAKNGK
jgi:ribosome-binding factor A